MRSPDAATFLFGKTRRAILGMLYAAPEDRFYLRELARRLSLSPGATQRELAALKSCELILRDRHRFYSANTTTPYYQPLRQLLLIGMASHETIRKALEQMSQVVRCAFVFGSFARLDAAEHSDIDLCVITSGVVTLDDFVRALTPAQKALEREINPFIMSTTDLAERLRNENPFIQRVLAGEKLFLIGDQHELDQLAEERMASGSSDHQTGNKRSPRNRKP